MKTLIIVGHPDKNSLSHSLADSYEKGSFEKGGEVARINLGEIKLPAVSKVSSPLSK
jgi:putative NADPH-quinone reductase